MFFRYIQNYKKLKRSVDNFNNIKTISSYNYDIYTNGVGYVFDIIAKKDLMGVLTAMYIYSVSLSSERYGTIAISFKYNVYDDVMLIEMSNSASLLYIFYCLRYTLISRSNVNDIGLHIYDDPNTKYFRSLNIVSLNIVPLKIE